MIYLIDGNNLAYRSEKTQGFMTNEKGERVGAIYGFINMLSSYVKNVGGYTNYIMEQVDKEVGKSNGLERVIVCFDGGKSKFRTELFPEYKGQRRKLDCMMTEEEKEERQRFYEQMNILHEYVLPIMGVKSMKLKGYEADDLIYATTKFIDTDEPLVIISTDKDMLQLVSSNIFVYSPFEEKLYTPSNFEKLLGVKKEFYIDYRILVGDSSDNINGIKGIGKKTASKLIKKYGGLNSMLEHEEELMKSKVTARLFTDYDILVRNNELMNMNRIPVDNLKKYISVNLSIKESFNDGLFKQFLIKNQMISILMDFVSVRNSFKFLY